MKRYIHSSHIMDHENKLEVMKWLDRAVGEISQFCRKHFTDTTYYETDDVSWGTDCINIPIFEGRFDNPRRSRKIDEFRFCYDPEDTFERSAEEQLADKLDEFLDSLSYRIK